MPAYAHKNGFRRLAAWTALAAACGLAACMGADATGPGPDEASGAQTLQTKPPARPGVPEGCTREWSEAARDSVLNCPDIPPPAPR